MKLGMKEIDGVPVTGIPDGSRTVHIEDISNNIEERLTFPKVTNSESP